MDRFAKLVAALACAFAAGAVHAGYAQLAPPAGWTSTPGVSGSFAIGNASNAATLANGTVRTNAALNVGGRAISVPASLRFAANAPRIAAAVIYRHPAVRLSIGIATLLGLASVTWDEALQAWVKPGGSSGSTPSTGLEYRGNYGTAVTSWQSSPESACAEFLPLLIAGKYLYSGPDINWSYDSYANGYCKMRGEWTGNSTVADVISNHQLQTKPGSCPAGWYVTPAGCVQNMPPRRLSEDEFVEELAPHPMPQTVPRELPNKTPLPVQPPVINPTPGDNPSPSPLFVPTGDPVRNPNYNPDAASSPANQPWLQPGVRVTPRPTPSNPWQVDVQPVDRPQAGPEPLPDAELNPGTDPSDKPREEDSKSLCEKHPEILACQNLDEPADQDLQSLEKPISITPDSGWGAENAACPAPKMLNVQGRQIAIPYDLFCTYMQGMRPIIIAMAWLSAAFILIGARESS